jgi:hypothetical protein
MADAQRERCSAHEDRSLQQRFVFQEFPDLLRFRRQHGDGLLQC